jgi:hypothetical protein
VSSLRCYLATDMKKPETDRELIDLIVNTLGNTEEQYILGSWENFVKKRKQRRKLILWFFTTGIAASLLIGWFGFRFFVTDSSILNTDTALKQQIAGNSEVAVTKDTIRKQYLIGNDTSLLSQNNKAMDNNNAVSIQEYNDSRFKHQVNEDSLLRAGANNEYLSNASIQQEAGNIADLFSDTVKSELLSQAGTNETGNSVAAKQKSDSSGINPSLRFTADQLTPENVNDMPVNTITRKLRFGVNFSPGVTSTNTVSSFNYSGGISADLDLSRRFSLSTGLQVEHLNVINEATDNPSWMPAGQTEAVLVGLDLPINVTWKFLVRKSVCYYVSGGISSIAYLSEKYITTSYSQKMVGVVSMVGGERTVDYQLENVENTEQKTEEPLNTFDFAGRVNIILGFEQHLSSKIYLHLEPYIKIPISELATQNLKFTTSGITCKISF